MSDPEYVVRASSRRVKTMTAFREDGRVVVVVPSAMSERQRRQLVPALVAQFKAREEGRGAPRGEAELTLRARQLWEAHLAPVVGHPAPPFGVRWVSTMERRWGSCSTASGEIRLSDRLLALPAWVVDYVLVHEMVHLVERGHNARFWELVASYPETPRARGFLEGFDHARAAGA